MTATITRGRASEASASGRSGAPPRGGGSRRNRDTTGSRAGSRAGAVSTALAKTTSVRVTLPVVGEVTLPSSPPELVFIAGVGVLAVVGALEWPVAAVVAAGHVLAAGARNRTIQEIGEALQEA